MTEIPEDQRVKLRPPPHVLNVQFGTIWNIATPFVYRYEDRRWIDEFFETGKLRLSTFSKFAEYKDEARGDTEEGSGFCYGETADGKSVGVFQSQGISAAVLCCSHRLDEGLRQAFSREWAFEITNTVGFALEVSRQLPGFRHGLEGSCLYRSDTGIKRAIDFDYEKYKLPDGSIDMQMIFDAGGALGGPELLLMKRKKYESQQEYRLLWELDVANGDYIDVTAPNARQHCRKVLDSDWS